MKMDLKIGKTVELTNTIVFKLIKNKSTIF